VNKLDDVALYKKIEETKVLLSIKLLADQVEQAWDEVMKMEMSEGCSLAKNVVVCGMGGSALGGRIVDSLKQQKARTPIEVFTENHLPKYVGRDTLVVVSSYSGNTEETLNAYDEAKAREALVFGIATGGKLAELLEKNGDSKYIIDPKNNPSGQPRLGLGYSIAAILAVLSKCEFIVNSDEEMREAIKTLRKLLSDFAPERDVNANVAKKLAWELRDKAIFMVASEHLVGVAHAVKNQLNETAKTFSGLFDLPELNHHLMEGLRNPAPIREHMKFLMFESELYDERIKMRYPITKEVLVKNEVNVIAYEVGARARLGQVFEVLALGSFLSLYLAVLYDVDPSVIPWVDYFKQKLASMP